MTPEGNAGDDKVFSGAIPDIYDRFMVPIFFEPYARDLADRIEALRPQTLLEVAAGTGVLTRAVASRLDSRASMVATDLNQPMLDRARARLGADGRIAWQQADALALPFDDARFDVVVCQFGVMFYPDKTRGHAEARRVLKPGGRYVFSVWDGLASNDFARTVDEALKEFFPRDPPRFTARTPHGYGDKAAIREAAVAAGFRSVEIDAVEKSTRAGSAGDVAIAVCQGTPLRYEIEARAASGELPAATRHVGEALEQRFGPGEIEGRSRAYVIIAIG